MRDAGLSTGHVAELQMNRATLSMNPNLANTWAKALALLLCLMTASACSKSGSILADTGHSGPPGASIPPPSANDYPVYGLAAQSGQDSQVVLNWQAPDAPTSLLSQLTSYSVYRATSSGFTPGPGNLLGTVTAPTKTYTDSALTNGTRYYYQVIGAYGASNSPSSREVNAMPLASAAPPDAENVFISTTGNDGTGDGSIGNPFASLTKALATVNSGGSIFVMDGTYSMLSSVTISKPVTIQSMTGDYRTSGAIFQGPGIGTSSPTFTLSASNITLKGIQGSNIAASLAATGLSALEFENCYFHDTNTIWLVYIGGPGIPNLIVYGNNFQNIGSRSGAGGAQNTASAIDYWPYSNLANLGDVFSYNTFTNMAFSAMQILNPTGITISHNVIDGACDNAFQFDVFSGADSVAGSYTITFNTINHIYAAGGYPGCNGTALLLVNSTNYNSGLVFTFSNNTVTNSDMVINASDAGCNFTSNNPSIQVSDNDFSSSNTAGIVYNCTGTLNAGGNYWGSASGPSGNAGAGGTGLSINVTGGTGGVTYSPFDVTTH